MLLQFWEIPNVESISLKSQKCMLYNTIIESPRPHWGILLYFGSASYVSRNAIETSSSPAIWQSYMNAILISIPDRSKYLALMYDLLFKTWTFEISERFAEGIA